MSIQDETPHHNIDRDISIAMSNPDLAIIQVLELLKIKARLRDRMVVEALLTEAQHNISVWAL